VGCLLANGGFALVKKRSNVDGAFERYVPKDYPESLVGRPPECFFWKRDEHTVGVHPVGGDSRLIVAGAIATKQIIGSLFSLAFFIDADADTPGNRIQGLSQAILTKNPQPGFQFPQNPGGISAGPPRCGVFVFPDNQGQGAIESILEVCAIASYPDLFEKSMDYLQVIDRQQLSQVERTRLTTGSNEKKARLSVIGSVLRPAAAIQNTIRDDRWVDAATLNLPLISNVRVFLRDLLNEPTI